MKSRAVLATLATSVVAGCASTSDDSTSTSSTIHEKGTTGKTKTAQYELRRISSADWTVLPEQVMQSRILRNTVPFVNDDVNHVVLRIDATWPFSDQTMQFRFDGRSYEIAEKKQPGN